MTKCDAVDPSFAEKKKAGFAHTKTQKRPVTLPRIRTEPYAQAFGTDREAAELERFSAAATFAQECGLGVNAGHDLSLVNLSAFLGAVPNVLEVSIGHALIAHALDVGLRRAVLDYMGVMGAVEHA